MVGDTHHALPTLMVGNSRHELPTMSVGHLGIDRKLDSNSFEIGSVWWWGVGFGGGVWGWGLGVGMRVGLWG